MTEVKKEEKKEKVATVLLSTTARAKAREAKKEKCVSAVHTLYDDPILVDFPFGPLAPSTHTRTCFKPPL
jgi:hypothetical protein